MCLWLALYVGLLVHLQRYTSAELHHLKLWPSQFWHSHAVLTVHLLNLFSMQRSTIVTEGQGSNSTKLFVGAMCAKLREVCWVLLQGAGGQVLALDFVIPPAKAVAGLLFEAMGFGVNKFNQICLSHARSATSSSTHTSVLPAL